MNQNQNYPPSRGPETQSGDNSVMSVGQWVVTYLIMVIPCVGLIMTLVWAFSDSGNRNRRNYCRAYLIIVAIIVVLVILFYAIGFALMGAAIFDF